MTANLLKTSAFPPRHFFCGLRLNAYDPLVLSMKVDHE
jgi:hypothetical protein